MVYSIKLLPQLEQLHPEILEKEGLNGTMKYALFVTMGAVVLFQFVLVWLRARLGFLMYEGER